MSQRVLQFASSTISKTAICSTLLVGIATILISCGGGSGTKPPVPSVLNINSSTTPSSPVNLPIEINGNGFQSAPGKVVFTQTSTSITASVVPSSSGWSDSGIVATVPAGNGTSNFAIPGTVNVTVVTSGGTSNSVTLTLTPMLTFDVNNVTWAQTTALPMSLAGLRAAVVPGATSTSAYVVTTGGYDGNSNQNNVFSNTLNADGTVGGSWTSITTSPLPTTLAHHGMAEADPTNSLVAATARFIYVLGGQQKSTDAPGGVNTVYQASVDPTTGIVGTWITLTNSLPESLVGPAVSIFNGHIYVAGGLHADGTPSSAVFSAPVNTDGTLGTWTKQTNAYPAGVSFATAFGFGGKLYVVDGDSSSSTDPNSQGNVGTKLVYFASAIRGTVGSWTATSSTIKSRKKHITWTASGQVIAAEGIYEGLPGSLELERTLVNPDSTLASWNGITANTNQIGANVFNAAAFVSPLLSSTNTPRFLLLGGQASAVTPATYSNKVYYNSAP